MAEQELRPEVLTFARAMEERLRANDHKDGWEGANVRWLVGRMREEFLELERELFPGYGKDPDPGRVLRESADVGNFALMLADVAGGLMAGASRG